MNVTAVGQTLLSISDQDSAFIISFVEVTTEGIPCLLEHSELSWMTLEELVRLPLAPVDRKFAEYLIKQAES